MLSLRDPIHGSVELGDWARVLVDSPVMQRLRRIQQLGTAHLVYPGAHHRRFEHCLGAYHLAGRLASRLGLDGTRVDTLRAAALLHDVGHGPFSHAFEDVQRELGRRHEETSVDLVRWGPLSDLLRQGGLEPVAVADAILGKGPFGNLVSGAMDADRMDYLLRDAHYTGVPSAADPVRIADSLDAEGDGAVLRESGLGAAEGFLTMRFLMYPAVYLHHTVRASEAMLVAAVRAHVDAGHASVPELERETDDGLLWRLRRAGGPGAQLVARLDERRLYKRAFEGTQAHQHAVAAAQADPRKARALAAEVAQRAGVPEHHVLLDVPKPPRFREAAMRVRLRSGELVPLSEASRLVRVLHEARLDHWRFWVFCPKADREAVGRATVSVLGLEGSALQDAAPPSPSAAPPPAPHPRQPGPSAPPARPP